MSASMQDVSCRASHHIETDSEYTDPHHIFSSPFTSNFQPDDELRRQIGVYLRQVIGGRRDQIIANLPRVMPLWGKVRLRSGGDRLRTVNCLRKRSRGTYRDNSFVRVCVLLEPYCSHFEFSVSMRLSTNRKMGQR
jgi:hypothetical protein